MRTKTVAGHKVKEFREDKALTQAQLADLMSKDLGRRVDKSSISKIETGHDQPSARMWHALARALGVDKQSLLADEAAA